MTASLAMARASPGDSDCAAAGAAKRTRTKAVGRNSREKNSPIPTPAFARNAHMSEPSIGIAFPRTSSLPATFNMSPATRRVRMSMIGTRPFRGAVWRARNPRQPHHGRLHDAVEFDLLGKRIIAASELLRTCCKLGELARDVEPPAQQRQIVGAGDVAEWHSLADRVDELGGKTTGSGSQVASRAGNRDR